MRVLVLGHPLVVDVNREVWSYLADESILVDIVVPKQWQSNLIKEMSYEKSQRDDRFSDVFALKCYLPGNGSFYFFSPFSLWKILNGKKYDKIILTQETWSLSLATLWLIKKISKNAKTKIFLWVCQNIKKGKLYFLRFFERLINSDVQRILGCCTETMEVVDWKGIKTQKYYLPFSIEEKRFKYQNRPMEKIHIGYIGRISEEKGIDDLLAIASRFKGDESIQFHVAGAGAWEDRIKAHSDIQFHGVLKHREVFDFYQKMHIIVLPSRTKEFWKEQFGRVIVEGAATGAIIVGSNSGAIPEVMGIVGYADFIFKESDVEDFHQKLLNAIEKVRNGEDTKKYAEQAIAKFSHQSVANLIKQYLKDEQNEVGQIKGVGEIDGFL